jgi:MFS family permease
MTQDHETASGRHATLVAVSYSILAVLPLFLASAQAVQLQRDLDFGKDGLGLAVSVCFAVSAVAATPLGNVVGRIGARAGLKLSVAFSLVSLLLLAALVDRWWHLAFALALCGLANATAQVATNVMLAGNVRAGRQGVAFGAKQASIPLASLAAGLALPVVGLLAGWRVTFGAAAVIVLASLVFQPRFTGEPNGARARERGRTRPTPLLLTIALVGLLAGAVANALPTFAVDSAVASGFGEVADRRASAGFSELLMLTGAGALALVLLAVSGDSHVLYVIAMVAVFASGWGWPGLIHFATVRTHLAAPAAASGFILSAVYVGNVVGPAIVGFIAEHRSYADAWGYGAVVLALATAAGLAARRLERRAAVA